MKDNDLRLAEDSGRGKQAEQLLANPIYQEALIAIRGELINAFTQTKFSQRDERDEAWRKLQTVDWFEHYLKRVLQTGKLADKTLMEKVKHRFNMR